MRNRQTDRSGKYSRSQDQSDGERPMKGYDRPLRTFGVSQLIASNSLRRSPFWVVKRRHRLTIWALQVPLAAANKINAASPVKSVFVSNTREAPVCQNQVSTNSKNGCSSFNGDRPDVERKFRSAEEGPSTHYHYLRLRSRRRTQSIGTLHALLRLVPFPQYDTLPLAKF